MKFLFLSILSVIGITASAQSLKETLYSGKLKSDTGSVIRKSDDLSTKIDTAAKKPVAVSDVIEERQTVAVVSKDEAGNVFTVMVDSMVVKNPKSTPTTDSARGVAMAETRKDNKELWKDFVEELTTGLQTESMSSNKVKSGTYSALVNYEIGIDGQITVVSVETDPRNQYLEQQITERITLNAPRMEPLMGNNGKPRVAKQKQMLTLKK